MKRLFKFSKLALVLALVLAAVVSGVVLATVITVDGDPSDWPGHASCTAGNPGCAFLIGDSDENDVPDDNDIDEIWVTNSASDVYFRFDTVLSTNFVDGEFVRICMDIPNQGPGASVGGCDGLNTDRVILVYSGGAVAADCNSINCSDNFSVVTSGTSGSASTSGSVTEVSASIGSLGLSSADDGDTLDTVVYFDNNALPPDDNIPDTGTVGWVVGTGSPTAVTFSSIDAGPALASPIAVGLVVAAVLGGAGLFIWKRRK